MNPPISHVPDPIQPKDDFFVDHFRFAASDDEDHWELLSTSKCNENYYADTCVLEIPGVGCLVRVIVSKHEIDEDGDETDNSAGLRLSLTFVPGVRLEIKDEKARLVKL